VILQLEDDSLLTGLILAEDKENVTLQTGASGSQVQKIAKSNIVARRPSTISIMPMGLLNSRDKEQILDLLAYVLPGGSPDHAVFKHAH